MSCTRQFLNFRWEHHAWRRRVISTTRVSVPVTDMWGRPVFNEDVRCHTDYVCDACGKTRDDGDCLCDAIKGERCAVRRAFIDASRQTPA
jgi:hypothetical protein